MPANIVRLAPNLPVDVVVKYLDAVPSNQGYEDQLRVKGRIDGVEGVLYLPGSVSDGLGLLKLEGAISSIPSLPSPLPEKGFSIRTVKQHWKVTKTQLAGEKHGKLDLVVLDAKDASTPPPATNGHASSPAPSAPEAPKKSLAQQYIETTDFVLATIIPKYEAKGIGLSDISIAAMVHTLFIQRCNQS